MLWPVSISLGSRCRKSYGRSSWNLVPNGLLHQVILGVIHWKAIPMPALPMRCLDEQISRNWDTPLKINMEHNHFKWVICRFHINVPGWCLDEKNHNPGYFRPVFFFVWGFGGISESFRDGYSQSHDSSRIFTCNWLSLTNNQLICHLNFPTHFCELKFFCSSFHLKLHPWIFVCGWFYQGIFSVARELCREAMVVGIPSLWIVHLFVFLRQTPRPSHIAPFLLKMPLGWPR